MCTGMCAYFYVYRYVLDLLWCCVAELMCVCVCVRAYAICVVINGVLLVFRYASLLKNAASKLIVNPSPLKPQWGAF